MGNHRLRYRRCDSEQGGKMTKGEHAERHKMLHKALDELAADWANEVKGVFSKASILDLMTWSAQETEIKEVKKSVIIVEVQTGMVVDVHHIPVDIEVEIRDYDVMDGAETITDEQGKPYELQTYEGEDIHGKNNKR